MLQGLEQQSPPTLAEFRLSYLLFEDSGQEKGKHILCGLNGVSQQSGQSCGSQSASAERQIPGEWGTHVSFLFLNLHRAKVTLLGFTAKRV